MVFFEDWLQQSKNLMCSVSTENHWTSSRDFLPETGFHQPADPVRRTSPLYLYSVHLLSSSFAVFFHSYCILPFKSCPWHVPYFVTVGQQNKAALGPPLLSHHYYIMEAFVTEYHGSTLQCSLMTFALLIHLLNLQHRHDFYELQDSGMFLFTVIYTNSISWKPQCMHVWSLRTVCTQISDCTLCVSTLNSK